MTQLQSLWMNCMWLGKTKDETPFNVTFAGLMRHFHILHINLIYRQCLEVTGNTRGVIRLSLCHLLVVPIRLLTLHRCVYWAYSKRLSIEVGLLCATLLDVKKNIQVLINKPLLLLILHHHNPRISSSLSLQSNLELSLAFRIPSPFFIGDGIY